MGEFVYPVTINIPWRQILTSLEQKQDPETMEVDYSLLHNAFQKMAE